MKAVVQDRYGSPEALRIEEVDQPQPKDNEVLVRVLAAAVNALDWHVMRGDPYVARLSIGIRRPKARIRGRDFAGQVVAVGSGVTRFRSGDEVFGEASGTFAEFVCVADDAMELKPANLSFDEAAAVPLAANTALIGLRDVARIEPGQRVLINGASGGVGTFAVQIAKALGATVIGVCSPRNVDLVRSLGADDVVDYTRDDFSCATTDLDVVLDVVGNRSLADVRRPLSPTGTLVLSGGGTSQGGSAFGPLGLMLRGRAVNPFTRQRIRMLPAKPSAANLATLRSLAESGAIRPVLERTYPLAEAMDAIRHLETEHARAKLVVSLSV